MVVLLLVVISAVTRQRLWSLLAILLLYLASTPIVSDFIFRQVERHTVRLAPAVLPVADAIVVLSGMMNTVATTDGVIAEWKDPDRFFDPSFS